MSGRTWRLWRWPWRRLAVAECRLCAAITTTGGADAHERWHRAAADAFGGDR